jgi:hypothetical protein
MPCRTDAILASAAEAGSFGVIAGALRALDFWTKPGASERPGDFDIVDLAWRRS